MSAGIDPDIIEAMARPGFYPHPVDKVVQVQTHISHVFLTGGRAYKLKKPLDLGFLDFSTLEARRAACLEELELNRRLAPEIYLQVLALRQGPRGISLGPLEGGGPGEAVEYCLQMREMDQERMLDAMLDRGEVTEGHILAIAERLAAFYRVGRRGPEIDDFGRLSHITHNAEENFEQTRPHRGLAVAPGRWKAVRDYTRGFLAQHRDLFRRRVAEGRVVDGHGDLHAANINLAADGQVHIFDCIEFNRRFRFQDLACDLAFLAMELEFHGADHLARLLVAESSRRLDDPGLVEVMDFYKCYRAVVRAKVNGFILDDPAVDSTTRRHDLALARSYWRLAARYAGGGPPYFLVCFMGLMGSGKSFRARLLARLTGWDHLLSDRVRKELAGLGQGQRSYDRFGQGLYGRESSEATYRALLERAEAHLAQGQSVIVDASFVRSRWREEFVGAAEKHGAGVLLVEVFAAREVAAARLLRRERKGGSLSDGRLELLDDQAALWEDLGPLLEQGKAMRLDGGIEAEENIKELTGRLQRMGCVELSE